MSRFMGPAVLGAPCSFCERPAGACCITTSAAPTFAHSARLKAHAKRRSPGFAEGPLPDLGLRVKHPTRPTIAADTFALEERARRFDPPGDTLITHPRSLETLRAGMYAATMLDALTDLGVLERTPGGDLRRAPCTHNHQEQP